jgi:hypothetical protein
MCEEIEDNIIDFSQANRICCFLHIVNLVAKSLLKQFDVSKKHTVDDKVDDLDEELENQLEEFAKDIDIDEAVTQAMNNGTGDDDDEDDIDGLVDEMSDRSAEECSKLRSATRLVMLVLVKLSQ